MLTYKKITMQVRINIYLHA